MAKLFLVYGVQILICLVLITQVLIPMVVKDLKLFWLFRPSKAFTTVQEVEALKTKANQAKESMDSVKQDVSSLEEDLAEIKSKTN